jgi:hypothetical protein
VTVAVGNGEQIDSGDGYSRQQHQTERCVINHPFLFAPEPNRPRWRDPAGACFLESDLTYYISRRWRWEEEF